jgi:hypothetical protein
LWRVLLDHVAEDPAEVGAAAGQHAQLGLGAGKLRLELHGRVEVLGRRVRGVGGVAAQEFADVIEAAVVGWAGQAGAAVAAGTVGSAGG